MRAVIRKRLTYANVMSSIAVFLVLGGATAIAAKKIGSKQLKANSVTTGKIKKNAVTTAKVKNNAVTGAKVNESTLGEVPLATNAISFNGTTQQIVKYRANAGAGPTTIFSGGGLTITAACNGVAPNVGVFTAATSTNDSSIWSSGFNNVSDLDFDTGRSVNIAPTTTNDAYSIVYQQGLDGALVTAEIGIREFNNTPGNSDCQATGRVLIG
jgi:hypothetical protein